MMSLRATMRHSGRTRGFAQFALVATAGALAGCDESTFIYRLPYEAGTDILIWQDHLTHAGGNTIDMAGANGEAPYRVVAARPGTVRFIADTHAVNCSSDVGCYNNYVWIQHNPGNEWSKYSHLATGSVTGGANLMVGSVVTAGQYLGDESNVGMAVGSNNGRHLHFEVVVPDDPETATPSGFVGDFPYTLKIPRFCGVPQAIVVKGNTYTASACP